MRPRILLSILITVLFVILTGCGTTPNCPTCGTTVNGAYTIINVIPVPEHNSSGEPAVLSTLSTLARSLRTLRVREALI